MSDAQNTSLNADLNIEERVPFALNTQEGDSLNPNAVTREVTDWCHRHDDRVASASCFDCTVLLCESCIRLWNAYSLCSTCHTKRHRSQRNSWIAITSLFIVIGALLGLLMIQYEEPYDYGALKGRIKKTARWLEREPCDRNKTVVLAKLLNQAGDYRRTLEVAERYDRLCPEVPFSKLRWFTYSAHRELSDFDAALQDVSLLIHDNPDDLDYRWWRGRVYRSLGRYDEAVQDFMNCLTPKSRQCNYDLSDALEKMGRPCDAMYPIQHYLYYHPDEQGNVRVLRRLKRLKASGTCDSVLEASGEMQATIRFPEHGKRIPVDVTIEGKVASFIVDTGATYVAISKHEAQRLGIDEREGVPVNLRAATGTIQGKLITVESMELMGMKAERIPVAIVERQLQDDGRSLLGLSFLSRFSLDLNNAEGRLTLRRRSEIPLHKVQLKDGAHLEKGSGEPSNDAALKKEIGM